MPVEDVIAYENEVRTSSMQILLPHLARLTAEPATRCSSPGTSTSRPASTTPSETVGTRDGVDEVVPWPVSEALFDIGFRDTFRDVYPDPVANPGLTHDNPDFSKARRPDRLRLRRRSVETLDSQLVGETGGPERRHRVSPWTSDHRAVLSTFDVEPVALPDHGLAGPPHADRGRQLTVSYNAPGSDVDEIAVVPEGGDPRRRSMTAGRSRRVGNGRRSTRTEPRARRLRGRAARRAGGTEVARIEFWVRARTPTCVISTDSRTYDVGRADRGELGRRPGEPMGLDRRVRRVGRGPAQGRLPALGLHRLP